MTYWSSDAAITCGFGIVPGLPRLVVVERLSSSRTSWHRSMHWSQMYTPGPATSLRTCSCPLPQNEQRVCRRRSSRSVTAYPLDCPNSCHDRPITASGVCCRTDTRLGCLGLGWRAGRPPTIAALTVRWPTALDAALDDLVDEAVVLRLLGAHEEVAIGVVVDDLDGLATVMREAFVEATVNAEDLLRVDLNVGRLAAESTRRLMDEHSGVRKTETHARRAAGEQDGRHRGGDAHADGADARLDVLHGVVDGEPGIHRTPRRVDVQPDVLLGILAGEEEQLRHDDVGDLVVDGRPDEDDSVFEQPRVDVHPAFAPIRGLDDVRDQIGRIHTFSIIGGLF